MIEDFSVIKKYRKKAKLTQSQVAEIVGVSSAYIQQLEKGIKTNPSLEILIKIINLLKIPYSELPEESSPISDSNLDSLIYHLEKLKEEKIKERENFDIASIEDIFDDTIIDIMNKAIDSTHLNYSRDTFSIKEIYEISSFVFNSYILKVNEILERHKKETLLLNKGVNIAKSKLTKKELFNIENLFPEEQSEILDKANEIINKRNKEK